MIKVLENLGLQIIYLNTKSIYSRPTVNVMLNGRKLQRIFTVIKNKTNMPITPLLFFKIHGVLTRLIGQMKEGKWI